MGTSKLNENAVRLLTACLDAVSIPYTMLQAGRISVPMRTGGTLEVEIVTALPDSPPAAGALMVLAPEILSKHRPTADRAFWTITECAGYGRPRAINRGPPRPIMPGRKTSRPYGNDPDRVIFRETVFRNVANPSGDVYKQLDPVIMTCVRFFWVKNQRLCKRLGFEISDLKTYAQVWVANYWSTGRLLTPRGDAQERMVYKFLRQRFAEFYRQMVTGRMRNLFADKKTLSAVFDIEVCYEARNDRAEDPGANLQIFKKDHGADEEDELEMERYRASRSELPLTGSPKRRRDAAKALLTKNLKSLPHDTLVTVLTEASKSRDMCPDTRKEALKQLKSHQMKCSTCAALAAAQTQPELPAQDIVVVVDEREEMGAGDAACVLE